MTKYQSDNILLPFLAYDLGQLLKTLLSRFIKNENVLVSAYKIATFDVSQKEFHKSTNNVNIGFLTESKLKECKRVVSVKEKSIIQFRQECKEFLVKLVAKLLLKCPLKYSLVRNFGCLDPKQMGSNKEKSTKKLNTVLKILVQAKRVGAEDCDRIISQYSDFIAEFKADCQTYSLDEKNVDTFFYQKLEGRKDLTEMWQVIRELLLLSHGQASVERSFSVNKEITTLHMSEKTLIGSRLVKDHINSVGGVLNVCITKKMMMYCASARGKYQIYLDNEKASAKKKGENDRKRKAEDEIQTCVKRIKNIKSEIEQLSSSADKKFEEVMSKKNVPSFLKI